jgi:hypothetical protein
VLASSRDRGEAYTPTGGVEGLGGGRLGIVEQSQHLASLPGELDSSRGHFQPSPGAHDESDAQLLLE